VALTKDDIDAVSIQLHVDGELAFSILLTRGGLTQRRGSSDAFDRAAIPVKGRTDRCFEDFMQAMPEAMLESGGDFEDGGTDGPRHDWQFEFGGGLESLSYGIAYHQGSASLPDEFADMVVQAERLTHTWWQAEVAEEMGQPLPAAVAAPPAPRAARASAPQPKSKSKTSGSGRAHGKPGQAIPLNRERMAMVVLLDLFAFTIPWSFLQWMFDGGGGGAGPPGAGLVLFAIVEFVLLQIGRRSPGYWLLGVSAGLGQKPTVDARWPARESSATLALGIGACGLGVAGLTSWTAFHTAVPYFGLSFPFWLSLQLTLIGSVGLILSGALVLRLDLRGVWAAGGLALVLLLSGVVGWRAWGGFVDTAIAARSEAVGRAVGDGPVGALVSAVVPFLLVGVPIALLAGVYEGWRRLGRPALPGRTAARVPS
jgi:hypothetical protein